MSSETEPDDGRAGAMPIGVMLGLGKVIDENLNGIERTQAMFDVWRILFGQDPDPTLPLEELMAEILVGVAIYQKSHVREGEPEPEVGPSEPSLASLFSVVDAVFTEQDAFARPHVTMGRIYREWKKVRAALGADPYSTAERTDPEVTIVFDERGDLVNVYSDARDAGYAVSRLPEGAHAQTVVLW